TGDSRSASQVGHAEHHRAARSTLMGADPRLIPVAELAKSSWLQAQSGPIQTAPALVADHVRTVAVFGVGSIGKKVVQLVRRCGWELRFAVDNNPQLWNKPVGDFVVRNPEILASEKCDPVII